MKRYIYILTLIVIFSLVAVSIIVIFPKEYKASDIFSNPKFELNNLTEGDEFKFYDMVKEIQIFQLPKINLSSLPPSIDSSIVCNYTAVTFESKNLQKKYVTLFFQNDVSSDFAVNHRVDFIMKVIKIKYSGNNEYIFFEHQLIELLLYEYDTALSLKIIPYPLDINVEQNQSNSWRLKFDFTSNFFPHTIKWNQISLFVFDNITHSWDKIPFTAFDINNTLIGKSNSSLMIESNEFINTDCSIEFSLDSGIELSKFRIDGVWDCGDTDYSFPSFPIAYQVV